MLKKILVPIDGTEYSWRAMEYAASLAKLSAVLLWKKNWSIVPMGR